MDAQATARPHSLRSAIASSLIDVAQLARELDVRRLELVDAFDVNVALGDAHVEREAREDRQLLPASRPETSIVGSASAKPAAALPRAPAA